MAGSGASDQCVGSSVTVTVYVQSVVDSLGMSDHVGLAIEVGSTGFDASDQWVGSACLLLVVLVGITASLQDPYVDEVGSTGLEASDQE